MSHFTFIIHQLTSRLKKKKVNKNERCLLHCFFTELQCTMRVSLSASLCDVYNTEKSLKVSMAPNLHSQTYSHTVLMLIQTREKSSQYL